MGQESPGFPVLQPFSMHEVPSAPQHVEVAAKWEKLDYLSCAQQERELQA